MSWPVLPYGFLATQGSSEIDTYQVPRSLRFNGTSKYLSLTPSVPGNRKTWTFSAWVKRGLVGSGLSHYFFGNASGAGINGVYLGFSADNILFGDYGASTWDWYVNTTAVYRDPSAWYHVIAQYDSTQATSTERVKLYVNGARITAFSAATYPTLNVDGRINQAAVGTAIGKLGTTSTGYYDGYMAEINFVDGLALSPSSFGETEPITGRWRPKAFSTTTNTKLATLTSGMLSQTGLSSFSAAAVVDLSTAGNAFHTDSAAAGSYLQFDLGSGNAKEFVRIDSYNSVAALTAIWDIQYSDNGTSWTTAYVGFGNSSTYNTVSWASVGSHRYWRMNKTNAATGGGYYQEVLFYEVDSSGYGTNGFYLNFADNSGVTATTLGKDSSTRGNNWTPNSFSVTAGVTNDSLVDSPTIYGTDTGAGGEVRGNYAVLNQLQKSGATITNGNLDFSLATTYSQCMSNIAVSSGKWYCELTVNAPGYLIGIAQATQSFPATYGVSKLWYSSNGNFYDGTTNSGSPGVTYTTGDIIGFALDLDSATTTLKGYKNGTLAGTIAFGISGSWYMGFAVGDGTASRTGSWNFGQRPFNTSAPSGYKALCTTNLTTPTIKKPNTAMDIVTYTGTGASLSNTSLNFSPDLVWLKSRSAATDHALYDSVRGATKDMASNTIAAETTQAQGLTSFDSAGFTIGTLAKINTASATYAGWAWDESVTAGFDIVSYTGTGANRTIAHALGVVPKLIIVKDRNSAAFDWVTYHSNMNATPQNGYLSLNATSAYTALAGIWNSTAPTSSNFSVGTNTAVNANGDNYIAYLWSEVEGFSKIGSYTGNASADGPFVWCGFRPKFIMYKRTDTTGNFYIQDTSRDTYNYSRQSSSPNSASADYTAGGNEIDILATGFKLRTASADQNGSGGTIVFAAFAETPFKYARAR